MKPRIQTKPSLGLQEASNVSVVSSFFGPNANCLKLSSSMYQLYSLIFKHTFHSLGLCEPHSSRPAVPPQGSANRGTRGGRQGTEPFFLVSASHQKARGSTFTGQWQLAPALGSPAPLLRDLALPCRFLLLGSRYNPPLCPSSRRFLQLLLLCFLTAPFPFPVSQFPVSKG